MRRVQGFFQATEDTFQYPDCPTGCNSLPNHSTAILYSKQFRVINGENIYLPGKNSLVKVCTTSFIQKISKIYIKKYSVVVTKTRTIPVYFGQLATALATEINQK